MCCLAAGACTGEVGSAGARPGATGNVPGSVAGLPPGASAGAGGSGATAQASREADDAMRARNPELFEIARQYFPGDVPANAPPRLSRLTRVQLDLTTRALLPGSYLERAVDALPRDPLQTNYEYADNLSFNAANFTPYTNWVADLAERVAMNPSSVLDCSAMANAATCLDGQARLFIRRAFRGAVSDAQLARFADFYVASVAEVGAAQATADLIDVALTSPGYVFREEVQVGVDKRLLPAQWLQSLSYTLADAPPVSLELAVDDPLSQLQDPAALQQTVAKILASPLARDKLMRFFTAWLEVREADEFNIATDVFPEFTPALAEAMVEETRAFLAQQLNAAAPRLKNLTQSQESFVSEALSAIYGTPAAAAGSTALLNPSERLGIFTQPAVIASHSGPSTTRLVKRGVFFTRKIMCLPLGTPPEDVDTTVPTTPGATERERIESVTNNPQCLGCHSFINPFGFMQENYDPIGRWRETDEGLPIDPSVRIDFLDEGPLETDSPVDALRQLTSSMRFQQCFARQLFRFYMGRDERSGDDPVLRQMFFNFADGDSQDIVAMLGVLAGSPTLSHRSETP